MEEIPLPRPIQHESMMVRVSPSSVQIGWEAPFGYVLRWLLCFLDHGRGGGEGEGGVNGRKQEGMREMTKGVRLLEKRDRVLSMDRERVQF